MDDLLQVWKKDGPKTARFLPLPESKEKGGWWKLWSRGSATAKKDTQKGLQAMKKETLEGKANDMIAARNCGHDKKQNGCKECEREIKVEDFAADNGGLKGARKWNAGRF